MRDYLEKNRVKYTTQKTFSDLVSPKNVKLRFDIFVKSKNMLIEFDGEQHYDYEYFKMLIRGTGKFNEETIKQKFEYLLECDRRKDAYAKKHGHLFIRIRKEDLVNLKKKLPLK